MEHKIVLYHGSPDQRIIPTYGLGEDRHDYGRGFYLTEHIELAKEWAVCNPNSISGWVHKYELDISGLSILDFSEKYIIVAGRAYETQTGRRFKTLQAFIC